jgi:hypothetical protein
VYQQQQQQEQQQQEQQDAENPFLDPPFSRIKSTYFRLSSKNVHRDEPLRVVFNRIFRLLIYWHNSKFFVQINEVRPHLSLALDIDDAAGGARHVAVPQRNGRLLGNLRENMIEIAKMRGTCAVLPHLYFSFYSRVVHP